MVRQNKHGVTAEFASSLVQRICPYGLSDLFCARFVEARWSFGSMWKVPAMKCTSVICVHVIHKLKISYINLLLICYLLLHEITVNSYRLGSSQEQWQITLGQGYIIVAPWCGFKVISLQPLLIRAPLPHSLHHTRSMESKAATVWR